MQQPVKITIFSSTVNIYCGAAAIETPKPAAAKTTARPSNDAPERPQRGTRGANDTGGEG